MKKQNKTQTQIDPQDTKTAQDAAADSSASQGIPPEKLTPELLEELVKELQFMEEKLSTAEEQATQAKAVAQRSLADYQNLVRRSREDKAKFAKMANLDLIEALIQPLEHLDMAATQIKDPGLDMVVGQFKQVLESFDLAEMDIMGKLFDVETMEAVEQTGKAEKVVKVIKKGYLLNGEVVQHAKVVLG